MSTTIAQTRGPLPAVGLVTLALSLAVLPAALAQAPPQGALASAEYSADPNLRCDILEVKRVSGGALNIRWRLVNTTGEAAGLAGSTKEPIRYNFGWDELYFIDPAGGKKYQFLKDSEGNRILDVFYGDLEPGKQRTNWAKFPAPPDSSTKISIYVPKFPPFEDVPVSP